MSDHNQQHGHNSGEDSSGHHHILSTSLAVKVWSILIFLTLVTVGVAQIDLGAWNFTVAMLVASIKASLVCIFFMGLKWDHKENAVIFSTSVIFMAIFMILTFGDLLTRGDIYVKGSIIPEGTVTQTKSKFKKPWVSTPELLAHGKEQFQTQCVTCHGAEGHGDGPASGGLNPKPRNFTAAASEWKNGRKPSQIFGTLTKGLGGMPSFASAPADDRWALVHYVHSLGAAEPIDTPEDLKKIGIDPTKEDGGGGGEKAIPIGLAIDEMTDGK
jgi:cytochrome c oxidase subunit 4